MFTHTHIVETLARQRDTERLAEAERRALLAAIPREPSGIRRHIAGLLLAAAHRLDPGVAFLVSSERQACPSIR